MDWFIDRLNHINPTLDYKDVISHDEDFRKLVDLKIIKHTQSLDDLPCEWCEKDHPLMPFRNSRNKIILSCFGNSRIMNSGELQIWTINRGALIENIKSKTPIIDRTIFYRTVFAFQNIPKNKKYTDVQELIRIRVLGIEICDDYIFKGDKKKKINRTDRCLIYFLYYKSLRNADECFKLNRLVSEVESEMEKPRTKGYIKNRITVINDVIRKLIVEGRTNIRRFIKHEPNRGYHLNPELLIGGK